MLRLVVGAVVVVFLVCPGPTRAQVMLDVSKITCWQFATHKVADPKLIAVWISGFHKGKSGDTLVDTEKLDANAEKLRKFCIANPDMSVMEAVEKVIGGAD